MDSSVEAPSHSVQELDEQHRELLAIVQRIKNAATPAAQRAALAQDGARLHDLLRLHFSIEEVLLRIVDYPRLDEHIGLHRDCLAKVEMLFRDGAADAIVNYLADWLDEHTRVTDHDYLPYLDKFSVENAEPLRDTFELAAVGIAHVAPDGHWLRANRRLCDMVGYSSAELLRLRVEDITHPDDREADRIARQRMLAKEIDSYSLEKRYLRRDGRQLWVHVTAALHRDAHNEPTHFISIVEDISARKQAEAIAQESRQQLDTLIETLPDAIYFKDGEGRWRIVNSTGLSLFGLAETPWQGKTEAELAIDNPILKEPLLACTASDELAWQAGSASHGEEFIPRPDGVHTFDVIKVPLFESDGRRKGLVIVGRDVTERKKTEESLRLAASVFANTHDGVIITDPNGNIVEVNQAFVRLTGYAHDEVIGKNPRLLRSGFQDTAFYKRMWDSLLTKDCWQGEITNRKKNGEVYVEMLSISAVRDETGQLTQYVGVFADISTIKENQRQLEYLAHYDPLTRLPNRVLLLDRMGQALAQAKRQKSFVAVCYLDLDNFKNINDAHGHQIGDRMLADIARKLAVLVRGGDTVARLGGDEFVILLTDLFAVTEMEVVLARIMSAVAEAGRYDEEYQVTASIGVTLYPIDGSDPDTLLRHADQAMYAAKQSGRATYHIFNIDQDEKAQSHRQMLSEIRRALNNDEFILYYQPKVNLRRGVIVGAEALIRWQHPTRGLLAPAEFLPFVDGSDLAAEVDAWVLREALRQLAAWTASGFEIQVSVNISARFLQLPGLDSRLKEALAAVPAVKSTLLELEILETAALDDLLRVREIIVACERIGVTFAIDDFGTGYSSLTYLKSLPAKVLKIDRSFVASMLSDPEDMAIIEGILGLARAFKRKVVAEGVETPEQAKGLFMLGCDIAQGYGIARPMPATALRPWSEAFALDPAWMPKIH